MSTYINDEQKFSHPYYRLMEFKGEELETKLKCWTRLELIEWLCWNDRNGVYRDADSLQEFGNSLTKDEAIEIICKQINQD